MSNRAPPPDRDASDDASSSSSSSESESGWESAAGADEGEPTVCVCLFCAKTFASARETFAHAKSEHAFDFARIVKDYELDFYGKIQLVNYVRAETNAGRAPDLAKKEFLDDKYARPVLEDDALLYSLDELDDEEEADVAAAGGKVSARELELEQKLENLVAQFREFKDAVGKSFEKNLEERAGGEAGEKREEKRDDDTHYFNSYAGNEIHETMLKDQIRTDAYRDAIYQNKSLFKDKVVLDVGCGTGVLSMFCAKAGAKKVIAVDNSKIIQKAIANVFENKLDGVITCLQGKIEEVVLPVKQVDIIVSEWMGYCLLYEAMLDSVLHARDRYLAPDGLMVPSECKLLITAVHDPDYMNDSVHFWKDIYGFSMTAMMENIHQDVNIEHLRASSLASEPVAFCHLPLHTVRTADLSFTKPFEFAIKGDVETLDAFVVYFDTFFATSRDKTIADGARAESWKDGVSFTTGPAGKATHWKQGVLLIEEKKNGGAKRGDVVKGEITYRKGKENSRELEMELSWAVGGGPRQTQLWHMR